MITLIFEKYDDYMEMLKVIKVSFLHIEYTEYFATLTIVVEAKGFLQCMNTLIE